MNDKENKYKDKFRWLYYIHWLFVILAVITAYIGPVGSLSATINVIIWISGAFVILAFFFGVNYEGWKEEERKKEAIKNATS